MVKVSVIIPVYNVAPYLGECLDSVLQQTLKDIEIVCVDDCSTDNSSFLLKKYAESDIRIRLFYNERNRDLSFTRNRGLKESCGEYVFFLDSDYALYDNEVLKELYTIAEQDDAELVSGRTVNWFPDESGKEYVVNTAVYPDQDIRGKSLSKCGFLSNNVIACNKLLRRSFLVEHAIFFDETLLKFEDNDFSCRVAVHAKTISYLAVNTYKYRQRKGSDKSKMYMKGREDAFWKCHAAKNMASAMRATEPVVQRIYAVHIGDMLRGAYRDFLRYGRADECSEYMVALGGVFAALPEDVLKNLTMDLQLVSAPLKQEKYADTWTMLYMYKKMRVLYYARYVVLVVKHQIKRFLR